MQKSIIRYLLTISIVFIVTCQLPTNPSLDPDNVIVKLTTIEKKVSAVQGDSISLCVQVNFPNLITNLGLMIKGCKKDTIDRNYSKNKPLANIPDTIHYTFKCPGSYTIIGYAKLTSGNFKYDSINFEVMPKAFQITIDTTISPKALQIGKADTIKIKAHANPVSALAFSAQSTPELSVGHLLTVSNDSEALVIIIPEKAGQYQISLFAKIGSIGTSSSVTIPAFNMPAFSTVATSDTFMSGYTDTLLFIGAKDTTDSLNIQLLNDTSFDQQTLTYLIKKPDTLKILFSPENPKQYVFKVVYSGKYFTKTIEVIKVVTERTWKHPVDTIYVQEGTAKQLNCAQLLQVPLSVLTNIKTSDGTVTDGIWSWIIPWGVTIDTIVFSATRDSTLSEGRLVVICSPNDTTKPLIRRSIPDTSDKLIRVPQMQCEAIIHDQGAGVGKVKILADTTIVPYTILNDSIYHFNIERLSANRKTAILITASDSSINRNTDTSKFFLTYDPYLSIASNVRSVSIYGASDSISETITFNTSDTSGKALKNIPILPHFYVLVDSLASSCNLVLNTDTIGLIFDSTVVIPNSLGNGFDTLFRYRDNPAISRYNLPLGPVSITIITVPRNYGAKKVLTITGNANLANIIGKPLIWSSPVATTTDSSKWWQQLKVTLSCQKQSLIEPRQNGYVVFRSTDSSKTLDLTSIKTSINGITQNGWTISRFITGSDMIQDFSYIDSGLISGTTYYYRVIPYYSFDQVNFTYGESPVDDISLGVRTWKIMVNPWYESWTCDDEGDGAGLAEIKWRAAIKTSTAGIAGLASAKEWPEVYMEGIDDGRREFSNWNFQMELKTNQNVICWFWMYEDDDGSDDDYLWDEDVLNINVDKMITAKSADDIGAAGPLATNKQWDTGHPLPTIPTAASFNKVHYWQQRATSDEPTTITAHWYISWWFE